VTWCQDGRGVELDYMYSNTII